MWSIQAARPLLSLPRTKRSVWLNFFALLLATLATASLARPQVSASIAGSVTDSSGAPISAAAVAANNLETGAVRTATTDDAGRYLFLSLPVAQYELRATKSGFREAIRTGIRLVVGQKASVD